MSNGDKTAEMSKEEQASQEETLLSPQLSPQGVPMELWSVKWEYHRYRYVETAKYDTEIMRGLGDEGWELVAVYKQFTELNFIFKRPKQ